MHADHSEVERIVVFQRSLCHQRPGCRNIRLCHDPAHFIGCPGKNDSAAEVDDRTFRVVQKLRRFLQRFFIEVLPDFRFYRFRRCKLTGSRGDILRDIHEHRTFPPALCDAECITHDVRKIFDMPHGVIVLGDRHRDAFDIGFLEGIFSKSSGTDVSGECDKRNTVHVCSRNSRHKVCGTRSACRKHNAGFSGCACISVCRVACALFMSRHVMIDTVLIAVQFVIEIQNRAARITEQRIHTLFQQHFHKNLGACKFHGFPPLFPSCFRIY